MCHSTSAVAQPTFLPYSAHRKKKISQWGRSRKRNILENWMKWERRKFSKLHTTKKFRGQAGFKKRIVQWCDHCWTILWSQCKATFFPSYTNCKSARTWNATLAVSPFRKNRLFCSKIQIRKSKIMQLRAHDSFKKKQHKIQVMKKTTAKYPKHVPCCVTWGVSSSNNVRRWD